MGFTLADYRTALRLDLKDGSTLWSNDELDRAVTRAIGDLNRFLPEQKIYEVTHDFDVADEAWTSAAAAGTYVSLANEPIRYDSETVKNLAETTCTRDTDYTMDYSNGKITHISGGEIGDSEACTISYTKSKLTIDISSLTDLVRVVGVEYPLGRYPQMLVSWEVWGDYLTVINAFDGNLSQSEMSDSKHLAVYYEAEHTEPTASVAGSNPAFLDEVICKGAGGYACYIMGMSQEHQAITDLASARTALGSLAAIHVLIDTALDTISTHTATAVTALEKVTTYAGDADLALDIAKALLATDGLVDTALDKVQTYLGEDTNSAKAILVAVATDVADLKTAINTALDAMNTYLDEVDTTDLQGAEAVWVEQVKHILTTAGIPNAEDFLEDWEVKINTVNLGDRVPERGIEFAAAALAMASQWAEKRTAWLTEASRRTDAAIGYANEAAQRIAHLGTYLEQSVSWSRISDGFTAEGRERINHALASCREAEDRLGMCREYTNEASQRIAIAAAFGDEADGRIAEQDRYLAEANSYISTAVTCRESAARWKVEADERRNEFWAVLRDRAEYRARTSTVSRRQPA